MKRAEPMLVDDPIVGVPGDEVLNWMHSWFTPFELPKPKVRVITRDAPRRKRERRIVLDSPFRERLSFVCRPPCEWELSNGRFIDDPLSHRMPPEPFKSKQHERFGRLEFDFFLQQGANPLKNRLYQQRSMRLMRNREPTYWWGRFCRRRPTARQYWSKKDREVTRPADADS